MWKILHDKQSSRNKWHKGGKSLRRTDVKKLRGTENKQQQMQCDPYFDPNLSKPAAK